MKEKKRTVIFIGLLISITIFNILSSDRLFSEKENRYLAKFPKLNFQTIVSGRFTSEFETYVADQFIGRDNWIGIKTLSQLGILKKDNGRVYFGKDDYLFDIQSDIDKEQFNLNMKNVNKFLNNIKDHDPNIRISALLVPTKTEVLKEKVPLYAPIVDEEELVNTIKDELRNDIKVIDLIYSLRDHLDEYIYYKTDHHWTTDGAYYGYKEYMEQIGQIPLEKDRFYKEKISTEFYGTSYRKANFYTGLPDEIYRYTLGEDIDYNILINNELESKSLYDEAFLNKVDKYSYFLGGDKAIINIKTSVKNDKTILILKDSFANSLIPFLLSHYEEIIVVDTRYYNGSILNLVKDSSTDEVLLLYNIQNFIDEKTFFRFAN